MIDEGLTQLEVRMKGGSRTITIVMDYNLLVNTKQIIHSLVPLSFEVEGTTLKDMNDNDLSNNNTGLALRVNTFAISYFSFDFVSSKSLTSFVCFVDSRLGN